MERLVCGYRLRKVERTGCNCHENKEGLGMQSTKTKKQQKEHSCIHKHMCVLC